LSFYDYNEEKGGLLDLLTDDFDGKALKGDHDFLTSRS